MFHGFGETQDSHYLFLYRFIRKLCHLTRWAFRGSLSNLLQNAGWKPERVFLFPEFLIPSMDQGGIALTTEEEIEDAHAEVDSLYPPPYPDDDASNNQPYQDEPPPIPIAAENVQVVDEGRKTI
jgi:hypothetical protein